jgi:hypothetical protein
VPVVFGAEPTDEIDACVDVTDISDLLGTVQLGTVCAEDGEFEYTVEIPTDECGEFDIYNVASFVTDTTGTYGEDDHTINFEVVGCDEDVGCVRSPGYYMTHDDDPRWGGLQGTYLFETGVTYLEAVQSPGGLCNTLARQWVTALLNLLNGASMDPDVQDAFDEAADILASFDEDTFESCDLDALDLDPDLVSSLATILDRYNNGLGGAPYCD